MVKAEDHPKHTLFTHQQIAEAAGCRPILIMKYIQDGIRGVGKLGFDAVNEHGQPLVSLRSLEKFAYRHPGRAGAYAIKALQTLSPEHRPVIPGSEVNSTDQIRGDHSESGY